MHRRICGTEIEYGAFSWELANQSVELVPVLQEVARRISTLPAPHNGGRLYMDHGRHPEYCTPECLTPLEIVLHEKVGDLLIDNLFQDGITVNGAKGSVRFYKTSEDKAGNTYGYHENYLMERGYKNLDDFHAAKYQKHYIAHCLIPFLVTRTIYAGAGNINQRFEISGRSKYVNRAAHITSEFYRPIVSLKDEPLSDRQQYRRLHLMVGDPNLSEYATFLKIGATMLVLDLIEDNLAEVPTLENPVKTLHRLAHQTHNWILKLEDGRSISAVDLQRLYLDQAFRHFEQECEKESPDLREMNQTILAVWETTLDVLEEDPTALSETLDWVIEQKLLERYREKHNLSWADSDLSKVDLRYHEIGKRSLFNLLQQNGHIKRMVTDAEIEAASVTPPHTRAKGRVRFIKKLAERGITIPSEIEIWNKLKEYEQVAERDALQIPDPFHTYEEEIDAYIEARFPQD